MNYLKELIAFDDWLEINPLDATTQTLWFHLMAIANKSGWPEWFTVANLTLQAKLGGVTKATLNKHRNILTQKGLLIYQPQGKQNAGKYKLIPVSSKIKPNFEPNNDVSSKNEPLCEPLCEPNRIPNPIPLYKQNEMKKNNTPTTNAHTREENAFDLFEREGFGTISPFLAEQISDLIDTYTERWVIEAMKEAVLHGKRNLRYVEAILKRWQSEGIDSPWERRIKHAKPRASPARDSFDYDALSL